MIPFEEYPLKVKMETIKSKLGGISSLLAHIHALLGVETKNDIAANCEALSSLVGQMKLSLVGILTDKGVAASMDDPFQSLIDKVGTISATSPSSSVYSVDLSIYGYSDEELEAAKRVLDYNLVGIWETPEGQKILNTPAEYSYYDSDELVNKNGYVRPVLIPPIRIRNLPQQVIPRGNEFLTAIYRGNLSYEGADIRPGDKAASFINACRYNYGIREIPGGNWQEMASLVDNMFYGCSSLAEVDLNLPVCGSCGGIFNACPNMRRARLVIPAVTSSRQMFTNCSSLEELYIDMPMNDRFDYTIERCPSIKRLTVIFGANISKYDNCFAWTFPGNYTLLKNICMNSHVSVLDLSKITQWGMGSDENRQSLTDTLITYSCDRVASGFSPVAISLHADVRALLTDDEIVRITEKGYTIA